MVSPEVKNHLILALVVAAIAASAYVGGRFRPANKDTSTTAKHGTGDATQFRPTNPLAVVTIWAPEELMEETTNFYKNVLSLPLAGSGDSIFNVDGTYMVLMQGTVDAPKNTTRRWPLFSLAVPSITDSVAQLEAANVELPWGIEEYGSPPTSRYVMFYDPAGNLIELVEWL